MKLNIEIELSEAAFDLLKYIGSNGYAEYRDTKYPSLERFKSVGEYDMTPEQFLGRNSGGTYYLIDPLLENHLVESDDMAWHTTYRLTNFGKQIYDELLKPLA